MPGDVREQRRVSRVVGAGGGVGRGLPGHAARAAGARPDGSRERSPRKIAASPFKWLNRSMEAIFADFEDK